MSVPTVLEKILARKAEEVAAVARSNSRQPKLMHLVVLPKR